MSKGKQVQISGVEADLIEGGLRKVRTFAQVRGVRALQNLSLIAEGFGDVANALGDEEFGMTNDNWRIFSLAMSTVLDIAVKRADEELAELKKTFNNIEDGIREIQSTSSICTAIGLASTRANQRGYGRQ